VRIARQRPRVKRARRRRLRQPVLRLVDGAGALRIQLGEPAVREQAVVRERALRDEPGQVCARRLARRRLGQLALPRFAFEKRARAPVAGALLVIAVRVWMRGELVQPDQTFPRLSLRPVRPEEPEERLGAQVAVEVVVDDVAKQRPLLFQVAGASRGDGLVEIGRASCRERV